MNTKSESIAVLITCFNRRVATLACLRSITQQLRESPASGRIFLVDDGSRDGTADAVAVEFPEVEVIRGDGTLFWAGGMRAAWKKALEQGFDYYLWVNDDVDLAPDALHRISATSRSCPRECRERTIIAGSFRDVESGELTYGGLDRLPTWHHAEFRRRMPDAVRPLECATMNGNFVLVPHGVVDRVGILDAGFSHSWADFDYGLRARKLGCSVLIAPGFFGTCSRNSIAGSWMDPSLSLAERWRRVMSPKGSPPREWARYTRRHAGALWPLLWPIPYVMLLRSAFHASLQSLRRSGG